MREIKFRIWDTSYKDWISHGFGAVDSNGGILCYRSGGLVGGEWVAEEYGVLIAQQFTGLKDKNGKEIYEGDDFRSPRQRREDFQSWVGGFSGF